MCLLCLLISLCVFILGKAVGAFGVDFCGQFYFIFPSEFDFRVFGLAVLEVFVINFWCHFWIDFKLIFTVLCSNHFFHSVWRISTVVFHHRNVVGAKV